MQFNNATNFCESIVDEAVLDSNYLFIFSDGSFSITFDDFTYYPTILTIHFFKLFHEVFHSCRV